jgi:glutathione S-transferase
MRLLSIAFSHYNEKARWALDRYGLEYRDDRYLPLFHMLPVLWAVRGRVGQADRASSPLSTPLVVTDEGQRLRSSGEIARWASDRYADEETTLYPTAHLDAILEAERRLHDEVGPHTRRVAYGLLLSDPVLLRKLVARNVGWLQRTAFGATSWMAVALLRKALQVRPDRVADSTDRTLAAVTHWSEALGDGRRYLIGDRFTAADLSLACMFAPAVIPTMDEGYSAWFPPQAELSAEAAELSGRVRDTAVGRHVLRMFAEERAVVEEQAVEPGPTVVIPTEQVEPAAPLPEITTATTLDPLADEP